MFVLIIAKGFRKYFVLVCQGPCLFFFLYFVTLVQHDLSLQFVFYEPCCTFHIILACHCFQQSCGLITDLLTNNVLGQKTVPCWFHITLKRFCTLDYIGYTTFQFVVTEFIITYVLFMKNANCFVWCTMIHMDFINYIRKMKKGFNELGVFTHYAL